MAVSTSRLEVVVDSNTTGLQAKLRIISKHLTALADELEQVEVVEREASDAVLRETI